MANKKTLTLEGVIYHFVPKDVWWKLSSGWLISLIIGTSCCKATEVVQLHVSMHICLAMIIYMWLLLCAQKLSLENAVTMGGHFELVHDDYTLQCLPLLFKLWKANCCTKQILKVCSLNVTT